jgi:tRNA-splicing ligase RtcB
VDDREVCALEIAAVTHVLDTLRRVDGARAVIDHPFDFPITLFAGPDVHVEADGIAQLLSVASIEGTLRELSARAPHAPFFGDVEGRIAAIVLTPDFHRGAGIPVGTVIDARGFVIPGAIGNDVCCGMRLLVTDLPRAAIETHARAIEHRLRAIFFRGERDIPMSPRQREALLREGLWGLHATRGDNDGVGAWRRYDPRQEEDDLARVHFEGVLPARDVFAFDRYIEGSGAIDGRDPQIGSVGGGNHFVEIQVVDEIVDGAIAHAWNVSKGCVAIMVHTGSVGLGHTVGGHFGALARSLYPDQMPHPQHGFYVLPTTGPHAHHAARYLDAMRNAANFAFANRLFLGLMALRAIEEATGRTIGARLVYDAPHNLVWEQGGERYLHRKGATPAHGFAGRSFQHTGEPVIIPGSMGASSFLLAGLGESGALCSACHGAGRAMTRGHASRVDEAAYASEAQTLRVVTPIDPSAPEVRARRDVLEKHHRRLKEEAPYAYKPITPVIRTVEDAGIARVVARMWPLITVKG